LSLALKRQAFFMISGPILEELLLSQRAIYRNISVGGAGLVQFKVPEGKTWIITRIHLLPFLNVISPNFNFAANDTFTNEVLSQNLSAIYERIQFQLLFYNPRLNSVYNIRHKFGLETLRITGDQHTRPSIFCDDQFFDTFHILGDNGYLLLKFFDMQITPLVIGSDPYQFIFNGSQSWPATDPYGYGNNTEDISWWNMNNNQYVYQPQSSDSYASGQGYDLQDQFIIPSTNGININNYAPPIPSQSAEELQVNEIPSIPFYNLTVIEINKRLTTNGIL